MTALHFISFLADTLALPAIEGTQKGVEQRNDAALPLVQEDASWPAALAQLSGREAEDAALTSFLDSLLGGQAATLDAACARGWALIGAAAETRCAVLALPAAWTNAIRQRGSHVSGVFADPAAAQQWVAGVVHEVGNALGAIAGWAEHAQRQSDHETMQQALTQIHSSAMLADASTRWLLGQSAPPSAGAGTDVVTMLTQITRIVRPAAAQAGVQVQLHAPDTGSIAGPSAALTTIVWNLVQNAIEASPAGAQVQVRTTRVDARHLQIDVQDQGPGIDPADVHRLFTPYVTTKATGTGLGLWLVQQATQALGAKLSVEPHKPHGTCFRVVLPVQTLTQAARPAPTPRRRRQQTGVHEKKPSLQGARFLVVEDDAALGELIETQLTLRGARVDWATSAAAARTLSGHFDAALIDLSLPDTPGDALARELGPRIDAIAMMSGGDGTRQRTTLPEVQAWLRKPFALDELQWMALHLLEQRRAKKA